MVETTLMSFACLEDPSYLEHLLCKQGGSTRNRLMATEAGSQKMAQRGIRHLPNLKPSSIHVPIAPLKVELENINLEG